MVERVWEVDDLKFSLKCFVAHDDSQVARFPAVDLVVVAERDLCLLVEDFRFRLHVGHEAPIDEVNVVE